MYYQYTCSLIWLRAISPIDLLGIDIQTHTTKPCDPLTQHSLGFIYHQWGWVSLQRDRSSPGVCWCERVRRRVSSDAGENSHRRYTQPSGGHRDWGEGRGTQSQASGCKAPWGVLFLIWLWLCDTKDSKDVFPHPSTDPWVYQIPAGAYGVLTVLLIHSRKKMPLPRTR